MTPTETPYTQENSARILLVDDHPIVREGVSAVLSKHPDLVVCGEAAPLIEALKLIESETPDLAIIDLSLADGSGLDLIARIKDRNVPTKMLVLSMSDELLYAERVLRVGAMGYLHKQEARGKLVMAIRQILEGKIFVSETINNRLLRQVISGHQYQPQSPLTTLSNRELEVFDLLGQGLSSQEIADRLHLGIKTIETHRHRIKAKLDLKNRLDLVRFATQKYLEQQQVKTAPDQH